MFSQSAIEALGFYVYALFDPAAPNIPFYIGKGCGNRVYDHIGGLPLRVFSDEPMSLKHERIATIGRDRVLHRILRWKLSEAEALKIEATLIDVVNLMQPGQLANAVSGHGVAEGVYDTQDLQVALNAEELATDEPVLIIKVERRWTELLGLKRSPALITRGELYQAVQGDWVLSRRRAAGARAVLVVARGLVRAVVAPMGWEDAGDGRSRMTGDAGDGGLAGLVGKSVAHLTSSGSQNPVRYMNC